MEISFSSSQKTADTHISISGDMAVLELCFIPTSSLPQTVQTHNTSHNYQGILQLL